MFKATCDVCSRPVTDLEKLKKIGDKLRLTNTNDICDQCQVALDSKMRSWGTEHQNQLLNQAREWITAKQDAVKATKK